MSFGRSITEQRERRAAQKALNMRVNCTPSKAISRGNYEGAASGKAIVKGEKEKAGTRDEAAHKAKLAALGCMACRRIYGQHPPGPVELHHLRGGGWGKGDYLTLIPLCVEHHRGKTGVHGLGVKGFPKHYCFDQADLLADALALIEQQGATT